MAGSTKTDPEIDKNNPGDMRWSGDKTSQFLHDGETRPRDGAPLSDEENRQLGNLEDTYRARSIGDGERNTNKPSWADNTKHVAAARKKAQNLKNKGRMTSGKRKKLLAGLGIGGGAAAIVTIVMMILPLKLEMLVQNATKHAMAVPGYAIQHRMEFIVVRAIAARMLSVGTNEATGKTLLCKGGGIACSLFKTYTTDFIEKKYGLQFSKTDNFSKTITVTSRDGPGGKAHSWTLDTTNINTQAKLSKEITSNAEMKKLIRDNVKKSLPGEFGDGTIKRYVARKVLMRKYGVTTFRGFEKTKAKIADIKAEIRSSIIKNIFGKFSDKIAITFGCLDDPSTCAKTIDKVDPDGKTAKSMIGDSDFVENIKGSSGKDFADEIMKTVMKTGTKTALKIGGTAVAGVGIVLMADTVLRMVQAIDNGIIDQIAASMNAATYIQYAYGDGAGIVTNSEKLKAGELDMDSLGVLTSMFDGAESSPLFAAENGISNVSMAALFGGTTAFAADGSSSGVQCPASLGIDAGPLKPGELVCDNQKINRNITGELQANPVWGTVSGFASVWTNTIGKVTNIINGALEWLTDLAANLVPQGVKDAFAEMIEGPMKWLTQAVFGIPTMGMDATGDQNYTALSGGIRVEANELMQNGVSEDGELLGGGGQYLSPQQVADLYNYQDANTPKPSYLASLFSPSVKGSLTQQFALLMPSSGIGLMSSIANIPATIFSGFGTKTFAASTVSNTVANNPFNQVLYGYPVGDPALEADPSDYTAAACQASADARNNSINSGKRVPGVPFAVYTVSDPCALEKMVVGSLLVDAGVTDDENSLKDPFASESNGGSASNTERPANTADRNGGWTLKNGVDYTTDQYQKCDPRTKDMGTFTSPSAGWKIRLCQITYNTNSSRETNGSTMVNALISTNAMNMLEAAKKEIGIDIGLSDGMRKSFSGGYFSMHTTGLAMDLGVPKGGQTICFGLSKSGLWQGVVSGYGNGANARKACDGWGSDSHIKAYHWLLENSTRFGFNNFAKEPWHYSPSGTGA